MNSMKSKFVLFTLAFFSYVQSDNPIHELDNENWKQTLEGEWMVKFYAPWCPACRNMVSDWKKFAEYVEPLGVKVGDVDITKKALLNGRFMVTALPTIFHFKNGEIRQYTSRRKFDDLLNFIEDESYKTLDALPYYRHPDSIFMKALSYLYKASVSIKEVSDFLATKGYSSYTIYMLTGLFTIICGVVLGLLLVVVTDFIWPPKVEAQKNLRKESKDSDSSLPMGATAKDVKKTDTDKKNE